MTCDESAESPRRPIVVADFGPDASGPGGTDRVRAARDVGADWVAARVESDEIDLRPLLRAAERADMGIFLRLETTFSIEALAVFGDAKDPSAVPGRRDRLLVVAPTERIGKRLRREAPGLPSALDLGAVTTGVSGLLRRWLPNSMRAAADADDLVVPWSMFSPTRVRRLSTLLRDRGSGLWLSETSRHSSDESGGIAPRGRVIRVDPSPRGG